MWNTFFDYYSLIEIDSSQSINTLLPPSVPQDKTETECSNYFLMMMLLLGSPNSRDGWTRSRTLDNNMLWLASLESNKQTSRQTDVSEKYRWWSFSHYYHHHYRLSRNLLIDLISASLFFVVVVICSGLSDSRKFESIRICSIISKIKIKSLRNVIKTWNCNREVGKN